MFVDFYYSRKGIKSRSDNFETIGPRYDIVQLKIPVGRIDIGTVNRPALFEINFYRT
jgi:hypothetical protein